MPNRITRHSASARLEMLPDGVLIIRLAGPMTEGAFRYFKTEILQRHEHEIRAFVADYTAAVIATDAPSLAAILEGESMGSASCLPSAMVARPPDVPLLCEHAFRMALKGVIRQVFTDPHRAAKWAARYAVAGV